MNAGDRALFFAFAAGSGLTGAFMLLWPQTFFDLVPGVAASGPYNAHLLRDVGLAYVTLAAAATFAMRDIAGARVLTRMAAIYLTGHALLHVWMESTGTVEAALAEALGVYGPATLATILAMRISKRSGT